MKILIACEMSGRVRSALEAAGHDAWSCDLLPSMDAESKHIQGDAIAALTLQPWDAVISFPPCTYLCSSGLHWNKRRPERAELTEQGLSFACAMMNAPAKFRALENPRGCISTRLDRRGGEWVVAPTPADPPSCPSTQSIQPYQFGEDASKETCLWLKGLPKLSGTYYVPPRAVCENCGFVERAAVEVRERMFSHGCPECQAEASKIKPRWANQTDSGQNKLPPSLKNRPLIRGLTYPGIAEAMGKQWGAFLNNQ